jgi:hypothetical protein
LEAQMRRAAKELEFEKAAALRDQIVELRRSAVEALDPAPVERHAPRTNGRRRGAADT